MHMMVAGLIVCNESVLYSWGELLRLCSSAGFVIIGIFILTKKKNIVVIKDQEELVAQGDTKTFFVSNQVDLAMSEVKLSRSGSFAQLNEELLPLDQKDDDFDFTEPYYLQLICNVFDEEAFKPTATAEDAEASKHQE